jgi:hypothetical protein
LSFIIDPWKKILVIPNNDRTEKQLKYDNFFLDNDNFMDDDLKKLLETIDNMTILNYDDMETTLGDLHKYIDDLESILGDLHKYILKDFTGADGTVDLSPYVNDEEDMDQIIQKKIDQEEEEKKVQKLQNKRIFNKRIFFIYCFAFLWLCFEFGLIIRLTKPNNKNKITTN